MFIFVQERRMEAGRAASRAVCVTTPHCTESASRLRPVLDTFHNIISIVPSPMSWVQYVVDSTSKYYTDLASYVDRSSIISGCVVI